MHARLFFVFLMLLTIPSIAYSQFSTGVEIKSGYSTYSMKELSEFIHDYAYFSDLPLSVTNDYPAHLTFGLNAFIGIKKIKFGLDYHHYSTAARAHYKDYSGEIGFDQIAAANTWGTFFRYSIFHSHKFQIKCSMLISFYQSKINLYEYLRLYDNNDINDEYNLEVISKSLGITPSIESLFHITNLIYIGMRVGYCLNNKAVLHLKKDFDAQLIDYFNDPIHTNWSGLRSEIFVGIKLINI